MKKRIGLGIGLALIASLAFWYWPNAEQPVITDPPILLGNQISNFSFESGTSGWGMDSVFTRTNEDAHDGTWSIKQVSTSGFQNFYTANDATGIAVTPNTYQILKFWAKVNLTSGSPPSYYINSGSAFGTTIESNTVGHTNGRWQLFALGFNPGSASKVWIRFLNNNGNVTAYYDDFTVEIPTPPKLPTSFVKSIDVMKWSKDVLCNHPSTSTVNAQLDKIVEAGATHVSISSFYDTQTLSGCQIAPLRHKWVTLAREHNLKIWLRMHTLSWQGNYSQPKSTNPDGNRHLRIMQHWLEDNPTFFQEGDIFSPFAEIQNGGINGFTFCESSICQFSSRADFNNYIQRLQIILPEYLPAGVQYGWYGFDGFVVFGGSNSFWRGLCSVTPYQCGLEQDTITAMNMIVMDHYPPNDDMAVEITDFHTAVGSTTMALVIGEYGTLTAADDATRESRMNTFIDTLTASAATTTIGFNYWHLGPGTGEGLVNESGQSGVPGTNRPNFDILQEYFETATIQAPGTPTPPPPPPPPTPIPPPPAGVYQPTPFDTVIR